MYVFFIHKDREITGMVDTHQCDTTYRCDTVYHVDMILSRLCDAIQFQHISFKHILAKIIILQLVSPNIVLMHSYFLQILIGQDLKKRSYKI